MKTSTSKSTGFMTIRRVVNGWIVHTDSDPSLGPTVDDTLVFNDIEALCEGIKIFYEEEDNESK